MKKLRGGMRETTYHYEKGNEKMYMGKPKENKEKHKHNGESCEECGEKMYDVRYEWHPELRDYFLVGEDGALQLDQPLDVETVEDDVREFIARKKKFG